MTVLDDGERLREHVRDFRAEEEALAYARALAEKLALPRFQARIITNRSGDPFVSYQVGRRRLRPGQDN